MLARISALAVAFLTTASASSVFAPKRSVDTPMNKLLSKATVLRSLEDGDADEEVEVDISGYSIIFEKCQFVKAFSDELAEEGGDTVLGTQRFVIFRLCPTDAESCNYNYGEYLVDMDGFLGYTVEYKQEEQQNMCDACDENCAVYYDDAAAADDEGEEEEEEEDEDGDERRRLAEKQFPSGRKSGRKMESDCDSCVDDCSKIANMEENNYIDATYFINCQQLVEEGDDQAALWAGPMCGSQGSKIKIGVFTDENCMFLDANLDCEDYLANENGYALKLSHALLKTTYDNSDPISCLQVDEDEEDANDDANQYDDAAAEVETREVCGNIYMEAAKCEATHGMVTGVNYYNYDNQVNNEALVCSYISSLKSGTYSQDGEIVVGGSPSYTPGGTSTTGGQKFALTFFILGTVGLAVYAAMLHSQLTKGGKADLSTQGGAMA